MGMFLKNKNHLVSFANKIHLINQKGKTIMSCTPHEKSDDTIYWAFTHIENPESLADVMMSVHVTDYQIWHRHLGHMNDQALKKLPKCTINFPKEISENFELIHSDLKTLPVDSYHKYKYFIVFVDDKILAYWIQCLRLKSDASKAITDFEVHVKVQYKVTICHWCIDAGGGIH